jgi:GDP-L-fucose synthase
MLSESFVNVGSGKELTIKQVAEMVRDCVYKDAPGRTCRIEWDTTKPNGTPRKLCDVSKLASLGWTAKMPFDKGIAQSYKDYLSGGGNMTKRQ